jgi:hypothetical protein
MKRTDLLNVLSFCDQLKPQLLVDVMVSVSKKHPDLPMFSSPDWNQEAPKDLQTNNQKRAPLTPSRSRHGPSLLNSKAKQKIRTATRPPPKKPLKPSRLAAPAIEPPDVAVEDEDLPPNWPKAGEGLYAKLPPEIEDRKYLADANDGEAFSQFMVDKFGKIVEPV